MDLETLLGLAGAVLFPLAVVVLVLWPILVAVIESFQSHSGFCQAIDFIRHHRHGCNNLAKRFAELDYRFNSCG